MSDTYHLRIKKDYAKDVIEDLHKMEAVELLTQEELFDIPEWQIELGREQLKKISDNPALVTDWAKAKKELNL